MKLRIFQIIFLALLIIAPATTWAKRLQLEAVYQKKWCDRAGGIIEYELSDKTRVDCLTDDYAIEFDFADKWAESIGQAKYYSIRTGRAPGVVLIMEDPEKDFKYLIRLLTTIQDEQGWRVWVVTNNNAK